MLSRRSLLSLPAAALAHAAPRRPNVVVILTDDQGYGDLGVYGATAFRTPQVDRMAAEGMRFTSFYAACVCTPSRAAIMTGCYAKRVGLAHRVLFPFSETGLNPNEVTVAEVVKQAGYRTACVGKWHLGHRPQFLPTRQGFDSYFGVPYSNDMGNHYYAEQKFKAPPLPLMRNEELVEQDPDQALFTRRYTEHAVQFIEENKDRPFFLYLAHHMPHLPLAASDKFRGRTTHGVYGDAVEELDWSVGEVLGALKKAGIDRETLVIFTSDNGPVAWAGRRQGSLAGSPGPLRGHKNTTWEGGMRVPCIMRWPGHIPAGSVCGEVTSSMDLMPTIAAVAGAKPPKDRIIDGHDIGPLMTAKAGTRSPYDAFYYYRDDRLQAVRQGRWKMHLYPEEWTPEERATGASLLLFDLEGDLGETTDVAAKHPDVVRSLQAVAERAREDLGDALQKREGKNVRPVRSTATRA